MHGVAVLRSKRDAGSDEAEPVGRFSEKVDFAKPIQHNLRNGPVNRQLAKYHPRLRIVLDTELPIVTHTGGLFSL